MWRFSVLPENAPERDPHEAEFFRPKEPSEAIVREFIQNSLDAKSKKNYKVDVKFTFGQITYEDSKEYFEELREHFEASKISNVNIFANKEIPYIIIEDFGTTGLDGMTGEDGTHPDGKNNFYNFWWNEGKSEKRGGFRGRWGLGKTTFHSASSIRSYWGYTVRENDSRKLLMGKALLKTHKLNNGTYVYYSYFKDEKNYMPISDVGLINKFLKLFGVIRTNENGFSIVIPYLDRDINFPGILRSTIVHYFYPIINNDLSIEISDGALREKIDNTNIIAISSKQDWSGTDFEKVKVDEFLKFIKSTIDDSLKIELKINDFSDPKIDEESFDGKLEEFRTKFDNGGLLSFRIPIVIEKTNFTDKQTFFDLYIEKGFGLKSSEEYYIRSGITISEIKTLGSNSLRGLLVAEDEVITEYLGDAETPAHTTWKENTEGFKNKYINSHKNLRFIKRSLFELMNFIYSPPKEKQKDFLNDLFFIEEQKEKAPKEKGTGKPPKPIPPPKPQKYALIQLSNGFKVIQGKDKLNIPEVIQIEVAYDSRNGNPFSGLEIFDLSYDDPEICINNIGCDVVNKNKNVMVLKIIEENFELEVTGFDLGLINQTIKADGLPIEELSYSENLSFRLMVVSEKMETGRIYGHADGIKPDNNYDRKSILPVDFSRDLGQQVWKLEFNDDPTLFLNKNIFSIQTLVKSDSIFFMYVFPSVIKEILLTMIFVQGVDDIHEPTAEWQSDWIKFAKRYLPNEKVPEILDPTNQKFEKDVAMEWIEKIVEEFCYSRREWNEYLEHVKGEVND